MARLTMARLTMARLTMARLTMARLTMAMLTLLTMGHEVLVDGCFNADPHPGNILYLAKTEQLGLIDYGQVKGQAAHPHP
jgi:predicted unusual protein kinase regulating ubiquinone biosynthesis (AarF/ABC1/UbiB family)